jgi:hypothetical protein
VCRRKDTPVGSSILRLIIIAVKQHQKTTTTALKLGGKKNNVAARPSPKLYSHTWTHTHTHTQSQFFLGCGMQRLVIASSFHSFLNFIPPRLLEKLIYRVATRRRRAKEISKVFFSSLVLKGRLSLRLCTHTHLTLM